MTRILEALDYSRPVQPLFMQAARTAYVHSVFPAALNIAVDETMLTFLSDEKPRMPNSARLPRCIMEQLYATLGPGAQARVGDGRLVFPTLDLSIHLPGGAAWEPVPQVAAQSWRSAVVAARAHMLARHLAQREQPDGLAHLVRPLLLGEETRETPLGRIALPLLRQLVRASREQDMAHVEEAARGLAGLGPGLTPSGDDTLGGFTGVLALAGAQPGMDATANKRLAELIAATARPRTTLLSATLLAHAARGEMAEQVGELLTALTLMNFDERMEQEIVPSGYIADGHEGQAYPDAQAQHPSASSTPCPYRISGLQAAPSFSEMVVKDHQVEAGAVVLQAAERVLAYGASSGGDTLLGLLLGLQVAGVHYPIDDTGEYYGHTGVTQTQYVL